MSISAEIGSAIVAAVAALGGVAITHISTERNADRRWKRETADEWNRELARVAAEFLAATRRCGTYPADSIGTPVDERAPVLGSSPTTSSSARFGPNSRSWARARCQDAGRAVVREVYAIREIGEGRRDPRPGDLPAEQRLERAVEAFQVALREQLGIPDPDDIVRAHGWG